MDELASRAKRDTDVGRAAAHRLEEHQIPGQDFIPIDPSAFVVLRPRLAWKRCAVLRKHPLDESAAIEPASGFTASVQYGVPRSARAVAISSGVAAGVSTVGVGMGKGRGLGTLPLVAHPPATADAKNNKTHQAARVMLLTV